MNKNIITVKELSKIKADIFPLNRLNYLIRHRDENGFNSCLYKICNVMYIDLEKLNDWLDSKHQIKYKPNGD